MEIVLHIGQSKTGTSALQHFLSINRLALASQGIIYPDALVGTDLINIRNHNAFSDSLTGRITFPFLNASHYFEHFNSLISSENAKRLIISAEHLFGGEPRIWDCANEKEYYAKYKRKLHTLRELTDGKNVHIVSYLRPQMDWFRSAVSQTVRIEPLIRRGNIYKNDLQFLGMLLPLLRYDNILEIWRHEFPNAKFTVVPYVRSELTNRNVVDDFCERLGIDHSNFQGHELTKEVNTSFTLEYIEVKKILNRSRHNRHKERAIIRCLTRLSSASRFGRGYITSEDATSALRQHCQNANRALSVEFLPSGSIFPIESKQNSNELRPNDADVSEAMERFRAEFNKPAYRLMELEIRLRTLLREDYRGIHAKLHKLKHAFN